MNSEARNIALTATLVLAFAGLVTLNVAIVFGLARKRHGIQALAALLLPPLAPFLAFAGGMRLRAIGWVGLAAAYGTSLALSW